MKRIIIAASLLLAIQVSNAQGLGGLLKSVTKKDSTSGKSTLDNLYSSTKSTSSGGLTTDQVVSGLKEALSVGTQKGADKLSAVDGFFKDAAIKILMPPEAAKVEKTLRGLGLGSQVDNAILSMNRAAEDAAKSAAPIFINAVKQMSINDAWGILKGGDSAATTYLRQKTTAALTEAFRPIVQQSVAKVDATKYWNTLFTTYNKFTINKVNPDLTAYVTEKALFGIFHEVALQEQNIRKNPVAQTTDILKKVFGTKQ
jgi:hypothetical protein